MNDEKIETIQPVVEPVAAYQDGAPKKRWRRNSARVWLRPESTSRMDVEKLAAAVEAEHGSSSAANVLG